MASGVYAVDTAKNETGMQRFVAQNTLKLSGAGALALLGFITWTGLKLAPSTMWAWGAIAVALLGAGVFLDRVVGVWRRWPCVAADIGLVGRRGGVPARILALPGAQRSAHLLVTSDAILPDEWRAAGPQLAQALGYKNAQVSVTGTRTKIHLSDGAGALAKSYTQAPHLDGQSVLVGVDEVGGQVMLNTEEQSGLIVAGIPGSGKTVFLRRLAKSFAQNKNNSVTIFDGKGTADFEDLKSRNINVFSGTPERPSNNCLNELRKLSEKLQERAASGNVPGRVIIIVDECHGYMATKGLTGAEKKAREEAARILRDCVALGRSLGFLTVLATQKPDAESLPTVIRDNCGLRACARLRTAEGEKMALGISTGEALNLQRGQMLIDDGASTTKTKVALLPRAH